jgi:hypothetical protein
MRSGHPPTPVEDVAGWWSGTHLRTSAASLPPAPYNPERGIERRSVCRCGTLERPPDAPVGLGVPSQEGPPGPRRRPGPRPRLDPAASHRRRLSHCRPRRRLRRAARGARPRRGSAFPWLRGLDASRGESGPTRVRRCRIRPGLPARTDQRSRRRHQRHRRQAGLTHGVHGHNGKIAEIDIIADPRRIAEADVTILEPPARWSR